MTSLFPDVDLVGLAGKVLKDLNTVEMDILSKDFICYVIKVMPYRTTENVIGGVVITFVDVHKVKQADKIRRLATVLEDSNDAVTVLDLEGNILAWNNGAQQMYGWTESEALKMNISELVPEDKQNELKLLQYHPQVQVMANLETDLLNILGSPIHLSKTIMNLVSNAAEAMPDGGTIHISTENRYIDGPIKGYDDVEEGDYVNFMISDTGIGIPPDDIERIFEPFYTKKKMGRSGTGLGMAVVWGTIKDHNGYIDVQSTIGKGTLFTLYFPVTRKDMNKKKPRISLDEILGDGEKILVVDDMEEQREIASQMLTRLGYCVSSVSSGEEALDYLNTDSVDLLVLDMIMDSGIDGLETYTRILKIHPGQKAIIASGFSETERVREAQRLGAGEYIKKPYTLDKMGAAVKNEIKKKS